MTHKEKFIPPAARQAAATLLNRRQFLARLAGLSALALVPLPLSALPAETDAFLKRNPQLFNQQQWRLVNVVLETLFPSEEDSPGAADIHAAPYLQWVLSDKKVDPQLTSFIRNGFGWLEEEAQERHKTSFLKMNSPQREAFLHEIETANWGESWLSVLLLYTFEALLSDPIYGGNPDGIGWQWLEHHPGYPRPNKNTMYGKL